MTDPGQLPLLLVTVGTDHHPFDRLVGWSGAWLAAHPGTLRCLMQTGTSAPPDLGAADWQAYLEFEALQAAMASAAAVVCHGGPGTILGARHMGAVPIVVPRQQRLGEHVDDHQVAFARRRVGRGRGAGLHQTAHGPRVGGHPGAGPADQPVEGVVVGAHGDQQQRCRHRRLPMTLPLG